MIFSSPPAKEHRGLTVSAQVNASGKASTADPSSFIFLAFRRHHYRSENGRSPWYTSYPLANKSIVGRCGGGNWTRSCSSKYRMQFITACGSVLLWLRGVSTPTKIPTFFLSLVICKQHQTSPVGTIEFQFQWIETFLDFREIYSWKLPSHLMSQWPSISPKSLQRRWR